ncbi:alpha/beta-hydrolase [Cryphonectria parasitica EP155]|uniref:Carboxypeptidase n=1 Tax=Cryphonectria parasitica (strain ATCC 38755 / EP155) TaxID=660469 RepID=A0A9P5CND2_CRYP1|nr:alpha/beta-hydrolase [Cryphonectria parasitica EP155]KAF3765334.1 alpha/beta-hydrolase [Cryphonectria parasitica EP155]
MHIPALLVFPALLGAAGVLATENPHKRAATLKSRAPKSAPRPAAHQKRASSDSPSFLTAKTEGFAVNGTGVPEVNFDLGESYAGRLPISSLNATNATANELFFWFFPSENPLASNEIVIWLNGGPGCSSMDGLFQENGPFQWQSGTYEPQPNPFSWTNLTNMVWIDQPVGTGLSLAAPGVPAKIKNETDVAVDFAGFWKNFIETFDMQGYDVYLTGESYAGMYVPYISSYFLDQNDTTYYNVKGIQINDPSIGSSSVLGEAPAVPFVNKWNGLLNLNDSFVEAINERAEACGYNAFMDLALTFPPAGKFPTPTSLGTGNFSGYECDVLDDIYLAALYVNPCFNFYHITDFCPFLWDELGFPSLGDGPNNYFNRTDVQEALNVQPHVDYAICGDDTLGLESSQPSSFTVLAGVVERTNNVIVGSGNLDFLLITNGTLATLNNMTWNGAQGFSSSPFTDKFFVPYNPTIGAAIAETFYQSEIPAISVGLVAGGGYFGTTHTERGLTFVTVDLAGHEIPQYVPGAAYRQLEFLLGRIDSLTELGDFTTQTGNYTGTTSL